MLKVLFHNKDITVLNICALNNTVKYIKHVQKIQGKMDRNIILTKYFNISLFIHKDQVGENSI